MLGAMSYRDESEALRARVEMLEGELADARARIRELSGEGARAPSGKSAIWIAAPTQLLLERELDVEPTPEIVDRLTALFRADLPGGTTANGSGTFSFRHGTLQASLAPIGGGRSRLRLFVDHAALGIVPPALALMMVLLAVAPVGSTAGPVAVLAMVPIAWTLLFVLLRELWGARVRRSRERFAKLFARAAAIASERAPGPRVATPAVEEERHLAEEEEEAAMGERRA